MTNRKSTLLAYATDEEINEIKREREASAAAEAERGKLAERAGLLEYEASDAAQAAARFSAGRRAALVAAALGEEPAGDVPPAPKGGTAPDELREAAAVIRARAAAKQAERDGHRARAQALEAAIFNTCAERAAKEYGELAVRLGELHAAIGGVQPRAARDDWFFSLMIPGSVAVLALRGKGEDVGGLNRHALAGGDLTQVYRRADAALEEARAELRGLVG